MRWLLILALSLPAWAQQVYPILGGGSHTTLETVYCGLFSGGSTSSISPNFTVGTTSCVPPWNMVVTACTYEISSFASSGNFQCGIYDSDGAGSGPGTLLAQGTPVPYTNATTGPLTVAISYTMTAGHAYWIASNASAGNYVPASASGAGTVYFQAQICCVMANLTVLGNTPDQRNAYLTGTTTDKTCGNLFANGFHSTASNFIVATVPCIPATNLVVTSCTFQINQFTSSGNFQCGIYDSDGGAGAPGTLLAQGTPVAYTNNTVGLITVPISYTMTAGHAYWLTRNASNGSYFTGHTGSGTIYFEAQACCSMANFSSPSTSTGQEVAWVNGH